MRKEKVLLILEDNRHQYESALRYAGKLGMSIILLVILEDIYTLEKTSTSLGVPFSKDLLPKAKERVNNKIDAILDKMEVDLEEKNIVAGPMEETESKYVSDKKPETVIICFSDFHRAVKLADKIDKDLMIIKLRGG